MHAAVTEVRRRGSRFQRGRRRWAVGGAGVVVAAVLAGLAAANGGSGPSYRTAGVERTDVDATLDSLGTIQPINQANLGFPIGGNVHSVLVTVGQHVTVGQMLAELDTTSLDAQVASAQSAVAAAAARLAADQSSQAARTVSTPVAPAAFSTESNSGNNSHPAATGSSNPASTARGVVAGQQTRLVTDQHQADQDMVQEKRDLATEASRCRAFITSADGATSHPSMRHAQQPASADPGQCATAITAVLADQTAVDHDQQAVTADLPALSAAIDKLMTTAQVTPRGASPPTTAAPNADRTAHATSSPAGGVNRPSPALRPASPEQLASDQAAIDAAQAQLAEARQAHDQAELRTPIDGTVGSVTITAGESVQGSSGNPQIVVIGPGDHQVMTSVSDTTIGSVRVGDAATVIPSGTSLALHGQVISIGLLAATGPTATAGPVSYPVTVGLARTDEQLFAGQSAAVSIMVAHASDTLTVPSSAVHHVGSASTVSVLRHGTPSTVRVSLGVIGTIRTQVLAGLNQSDQVILADLSQPLPTSGIQSLRRATGGASGRSGG